MRRPMRYLPVLDERAKPCVVKGVVNGRRGSWLNFYVFGSATDGNAVEVVCHERWLSEDWMSAMSKARRMASTCIRSQRASGASIRNGGTQLTSTSAIHPATGVARRISSRR